MTAQTDDTKFIPVEVAAALLGVSLSTFRRLAAATGFPAPIHLGRLVRWDRAALLAWASARADSILLPRLEDQCDAECSG